MIDPEYFAFIAKYLNVLIAPPDHFDLDEVLSGFPKVSDPVLDDNMEFAFACCAVRTLLGEVRMAIFAAETEPKNCLSAPRSWRGKACTFRPLRKQSER